jgi:hypothetical protein
MSLVLYVSVLTEEQFSRGWFLSRRRARTILRAYVEEGLLGMARVITPPTLPLDTPLHLWQPGDRVPQFGRLSFAARKRWQAAPIPTTVYFATEFTADRFGGVACSKASLLQAAHELHVAELYIRHRQSQRDSAVEWIRGDIFAGGFIRCTRVPDAVVVCSCGCRKIQKAVEFAGAYPSVRLRSFHDFCEENEIPYEIW